MREPPAHRARVLSPSQARADAVRRRGSLSTIPRSRAQRPIVLNVAHTRFARIGARSTMGSRSACESARVMVDSRRPPHVGTTSRMRMRWVSFHERGLVVLFACRSMKALATPEEICEIERGLGLARPSPPAFPLRGQCRQQGATWLSPRGRGRTQGRSSDSATERDLSSPAVYAVAEGPRSSRRSLNDEIEAAVRPSGISRRLSLGLIASIAACVKTFAIVCYPDSPRGNRSTVSRRVPRCYAM